MSERTKIFLDGQCVVCDLEVSHYKRMAPHLFEIIDISDSKFDAAAHGLTTAAVNKHLHVQTPSGEILKGVEAFEHIWSRLPRYQWASRLVKNSVVKSIARVGYAGFVEIRPWLPKKS